MNYRAVPRNPLLFTAITGLTAACAEPTVEEIRTQASEDLYAMLRHSAKTLGWHPGCSQLQSP